ncbi:MAG: TraB/GumN family protein [Candidatus Diapherotrites archaeon]
MVVTRVRLKDKEIILVGTAHVSRQSIDEVRKIITEEKPACVAIELDRSRFLQLSEEQKWKKTDVFSVIRKGKTHLLLFNILLSSMQRRIGQELGIKPGSEMLEAAKLAKEKNIPVVFVDRDIEITMKRTFAAMGFIEKIKLFSELVMYFFGFGETLTPEQIEELKREDIITALVRELSAKFPSIKKVIIDERDQYIAASISQIKAKKIVAVVGAGHLKGITDNLNKKIDLNKLKQVPRKRDYSLVLGSMILVIFVLLLLFGFYLKGPQFLISAFLIWFLVNGSFSALGALLVRAHWQSVVTAFLVAPITTLHPALASGWFAGFVEAKARPPLVEDMENIPKIESIRDINRNRFTHILVVVSAVNIASSIGTFVSLALIAHML